MANIAFIGVDKKSGAPIVQRSNIFTYNNDPNGTTDIFYHFGSRLRSSPLINPDNTIFLTASRLQGGGIIGSGANAVDNSILTSLFTGSTNSSDGLQVQFLQDDFILDTYQINSNSTAWTLEGSTDGVLWTPLTQGAPTNLGNNWSLIPVTNSTPYSYYRILHGDANSKDLFAIKFFGTYNNFDISFSLDDEATIIATHGNSGKIYMPNAVEINAQVNYYCIIYNVGTGDFTFDLFTGATAFVDNTNGKLEQGEQLIIRYDGTNWELYEIGSSIDLGTKGALLSHDGVESSILTVGANDTFLVADSAETTGLKWSTVNLNTISSPTSDYDFNSQKIINLGNPTNSQDAVTKAYADSIAAGFDPKQSCEVATTNNLNTETGNTWTASGSGVGKTLTQTGVNTAIIDNVLLVNGYRVLIKNESPPTHNGIYEISGAGGTEIVLTRTTDFDNSTVVTPGANTFITQGSINAGKGFVLLGSGTLTIDTSNLNFTQYAGSGSLSLDALNDVSVGTPGVGDDNKFVGWNNTNNQFELLEKPGNFIGDLVQLENVSSNPGLPAVDGTQLSLNSSQITPLTTKGDVWTYSTTDTRLGVGVDNEIIFADSSTTEGLKYKALTSTYINLDHTLTELQFNIPQSTDNPYSLELTGIDVGGYVSNSDQYFNLTLPFTIEFWVNLDDHTTINQYIVSRFANNNGWGVIISNGSLVVNAGDGTAQNVTLNSVITTSNTWNHLAIVFYDNAGTVGIKLYKNGGFVTSANIGTLTNINYTDPTTGLVIGAQPNTSGSIAAGTYNFQGKLNNIRIWSDERASGEISANYNQNLFLTVRDYTLLTEWKFLEGLGNTTQDSVSNKVAIATGGGNYSWATDTPYQNIATHNLTSLVIDTNLSPNLEDFLQWDGIKFTTNNPSGTNIGDLIKLDNLNGIAAYPAIDGSQITNLSVAAGQGSPLTTKGDVYIHNGSTNIRLPIGVDGTVLTPDSTTGEGIKYDEIRNLLRETKEITTSPYTIQADDERQILVVMAASNIELPDTLNPGFFILIQSNQVGAITFTPIGSASIINNQTMFSQGDAGLLTLISGDVWVFSKIEKSLVTTKGDILSFSTQPEVISVGTNGQVLVANDSASTGFRWEDRADADDLIYATNVPEVTLSHTADDIFRYIGTEGQTTSYTNPTTNGNIIATTNSTAGITLDDPNVITDNIDDANGIQLNTGEFVQWQFNTYTVQPYSIWVYDNANISGTNIYDIEVSNNGSSWTNVGQITLVGTEIGLWKQVILTANGYFSYIRVLHNSGLSTGTVDIFNEIKLFGWIKANPQVGEIFAVSSTGITPIKATADNQILIADSSEPVGVKWDKLPTEAIPPLNIEIRVDPGIINFSTNGFNGIINILGTLDGAESFINPVTRGSLVVRGRTSTGTFDDPTNTITNQLLSGAGVVLTTFSASSTHEILFLDFLQLSYVKPTVVSIYASTGSPGGSESIRDFILEGSEDDSNWFQLGTTSWTRTGSTPQWWDIIVTQNTTSQWRYLRINYSNNDSNPGSGTTGSLREIEVYGEYIPINPTLVLQNTDLAKVLITSDTTSNFVLNIPDNSSQFPAGWFVYLKNATGNNQTIIAGQVLATINSASGLILDRPEEFGLLFNPLGNNDWTFINMTHRLPNKVEVNEESIIATKQLTILDSNIQVIDPNGANRIIVLPDPPIKDLYFKLINSDAANYNIDIEETLSGGVIQTLDINTPYAEFHYTGTQWIVTT